VAKSSKGASKKSKTDKSVEDVVDATLENADAEAS
jgi:hypothetical protein